jgi:hypothetical protein
MPGWIGIANGVLAPARVPGSLIPIRSPSTVHSTSALYHLVTSEEKLEESFVPRITLVCSRAVPTNHSKTAAVKSAYAIGVHQEHAQIQKLKDFIHVTTTSVLNAAGQRDPAMKFAASAGVLIQAAPRCKALCHAGNMNASMKIAKESWTQEFRKLSSVKCTDAGRSSAREVRGIPCIVRSTPASATTASGKGFKINSSVWVTYLSTSAMIAM